MWIRSGSFRSAPRPNGRCGVCTLVTNLRFEHHERVSYVTRGSLERSLACATVLSAGGRGERGLVLDALLAEDQVRCK